MSIPLETPAPPSLTIGELQELDIVSPEQFISTLDYYVEKGLSIGNVLVNIMYTITFSIEEFHLIRDAATRGA